MAPAHPQSQFPWCGSVFQACRTHACGKCSALESTWLHSPLLCLLHVPLSRTKHRTGFCPWSHGKAASSAVASSPLWCLEVHALLVVVLLQLRLHRICSAWRVYLVLLPARWGPSCVSVVPQQPTRGSHSSIVGQVYGGQPVLPFTTAVYSFLTGGASIVSWCHTKGQLGWCCHAPTWAAAVPVMGS
jgi:hypothetical protein